MNESGFERDETLGNLFIYEEEASEPIKVFGSDTVDDTASGYSQSDPWEQGMTDSSFLEDDFRAMTNRLLSDILPDAVVNERKDSEECLFQTVRPTRTVRFRRGGGSSRFSQKRTDSQDETDSVLVSDSGLSSDTSEVVSGSSTLFDSLPLKRRGGWPKGRKRKPENKTDIRPPKAPATGYVLFLNEKRKDYKDMPFTEVTKLLGNEWSRLSINVKKKYLIQAEVERKRYREELRIYRQSEAFKLYLQRKRLKRFQGHATEESDMDATDEIDDEDNEELYCRSCDQWFQSLHNKKEHLYGRQHLHHAAAGASTPTASASTSANSMDESSLDAADHCVSMQQLIVQFSAANLERERELRHLKQNFSDARLKNSSLAQRLASLHEIRRAAEIRLQQEKNERGLIEQNLLKILKITNLFEIKVESKDM